MQPDPMHGRGAPLPSVKRRLARDDEAYRQLFESQNKAVLLLGHDLSVEDCNAQALALFRCSRAVLIGKPAVELVPLRQPDGMESAQGLQQAVAAALQGLPQSLLGYLQTVDGLSFEALVQLQAIDLDGRPQVVAHVRDLTRLREAEKQLEASELRLRQVLDHTPTPIFIRDLEGRFLFVNQRFCAVHGKSADQLIGTLDAQLLPPDVLLQVRANTQQVLERRTSAEFEETIVLDGEPTTFLSSKFPLLDPLGQPYAVCGVATDITARKRAEEALRASELQYRSIFNASVDGMVVLDEQGGIADANPAFLTLLGYRREEVLGRQPDEVLGTGGANMCRELTTGLAQGHMFQRECTALTRESRPVEIEVRGASMHYQGRPHVLVIVRDLTRRRQAEAERARLETQLRQAQKMEAIGHLTGGIAHDFNNILTSIMGYLALAGERRTTHRDARLSKYLELAQLASTRARDLIQQMLTFSRGRRGEARPLRLAPLVKESIKLLRSTLPATIGLETDFVPDLPAVRLDPVQMGQVLLNLCINARDAMPAGGTIRVGLRMIERGEEICTSCRDWVRGQDFVELSVGDTGAGIAPDVLDRMFEPFFSTKEVGKGSGMGLATVHGIVHEHGGHVVVDTAPGEGARFRVLLPALAGKAATVEQEAPARVALNRARPRLNGRVLVVEDEEMVGEFMADLLDSWGLSVIVKSNPEEARELLASDPAGFDLVVTDYTMPRGTGLDLARHLELMRPDLPIVLYTGYSEAVDEQDARRCGVRALVKKPLEPAAFLSVLRAYLPAAQGAAQAREAVKERGLGA
jgi:PAS domain S-box-containing protein